LIGFVAILGGCVHQPAPVVETSAPRYQVPAGTWRAIDEQILGASVFARHEADTYARVAMDDWRDRVRRRIGEVFVPWYASYWTQQWIATRVAWYKLQYTEGEATPEERLVGYLQEQFYEQVLEPVRSFVDPHAVMEETAAGYVRELKCRLDRLPFEYRIPVAAFNQHLDTIPVIVVLAVPLQDASLYEVLQATDLSAVPAYVTLLGQIAAVNGRTDPTPSPDRLHGVARRAVTRLVGPLALRGGATAASTLVGGFMGVLISAGAAAWGVVEHDNERPGVEAQLRDNLEATLELIWQALVEDPHGGVTAVVHHMSAQLEHAVFHPLQTPLTPYILEPAGLF
jgi:hypothetical protein